MAKQKTKTRSAKSTGMDKEMLARIDERQKNMDEKLDTIYEQTKKTNGRVTDLEKWRSSVYGGWFVICVVCALLSGAIGIAIKFL